MSQRETMSTQAGFATPSKRSTTRKASDQQTSRPAVGPPDNQVLESRAQPCSRAVPETRIIAIAAPKPTQVLLAGGRTRRNFTDGTEPSISLHREGARRRPVQKELISQRGRQLSEGSIPHLSAERRDAPAARTMRGRMHACVRPRSAIFRMRAKMHSTCAVNRDKKLGDRPRRG